MYDVVQSRRLYKCRASSSFAPPDRTGEPRSKNQMDVRSFNPSSLPHLPSADLGAARRAGARFGLGHRRVNLTLAPFGDLTLTFSEIGPALPPAANDCLFRVRRALDHGWVLMDGLAGLRVVSAILGIPGPQIHRRLGSSERGILMAALASVLRAARGTTVTAARPEEWSGVGLARVQIHAESEMVRQHLCVDVPPHWIPSEPPERLLAAMRARALRLTLAVRVAKTTLSASDWSRARPGDAVVFDEAHPGDPHLGSLPVRLIIGGYQAGAVIDPHGRAVLASSFEASPFEPSDPRNRSIMSHEITQQLNYAVIASAPIEIVAELGRVVLSAEEVVALQPGSVVTLGPINRAAIELRVGDRPWATGELVDVDGLIGVRLLSVPGATPEAPARDADTLRP
jgi:type III secretion system YscQ/HrcQ family protein